MVLKETIQYWGRQPVGISSTLSITAYVVACIPVKSAGCNTNISAELKALLLMSNSCSLKRVIE
jgi:hypothetical protein